MGTPTEFELVEMYKSKVESDEEGELSPLSPITYTIPPPSPISRLEKTKSLLNDLWDMMKYVYNK